MDTRTYPTGPDPYGAGDSGSARDEHDGFWPLIAEILPLEHMMHEQWDLWMDYQLQYSLDFDAPSVI